MKKNNFVIGLAIRCTNVLCEDGYIEHSDGSNSRCNICKGTGYVSKDIRITDKLSNGDKDGN